MHKEEQLGSMGGAMGNSIKHYAPRIFISATSRDLGSYRQLVCEEILNGDCLPVVQEHFPSSARKLSEFLEDVVRKCDTVICLLGPRFGEAPETCEGESRSYTQREYDAARQLNKNIYVFLASPSCEMDDNTPETEEKRLLQQAHIMAIQQKDQSICKMFSDREELRAHIIRLVPLLAGSRQPKYCVQSPSPYAYFAGRETELQQLTEAVTGANPSVVAVLGVAGQGKTTLAWEWFSNHCPDIFAAAFWCPAEENEFTFDMFVDLALTYLTQGKYDKRSFPCVQTRIRMLLQHLRDRPCLLAVDGLEKWLNVWMKAGSVSLSVADSDGRRGGQDGLDLFLEQLCAVSGGSHVILTSRVLPAALDSAPHAVIPVVDEIRQARLQGLDDAAAVILLRKLGVKAGDEEILAVARDLENHPLSLTILGKLAARKYGGSLDRFRSETHLVADDEKIRGLLEKMQDALPSRADSAHLLDLLAHFIETPGYEQYAAFLRWLVLQPGHGALVDRPVLHLDDDALREGLAVLDDWSLITWDRDSSSLYLHPLLREYFKSRSASSVNIHKALADWYLTLTPPDDARSLQDMRSRILAIEHGLLAGNPTVCDAAVLLPVAECFSLSEWLALWGHQSAGIDLLAKVLARSGEPERSKHLVSRGAMLQDLDKLALARSDLSEAIRWLGSGLRRRLKYRDLLAGACMNRGNSHAESGTPDRAVDDFDMALRVLAAPLGMSMWDETIKADILMNRGAAMRDLGHLTTAERDATRALSIYQKHQASEPGMASRSSRQIATALLNRGNACANGRRYDQAGEDYRSALDALSRFDGDLLGRALPLVATIREMRGLLFNDMNEPERAMEEHNAAVSVFSELVRQGRLDLRTMLALAYSNRTETLITLGKLPLALEDIEAAKRIYDQTEWEDASRLAIWLTANQTTIRGLSRILGRDISIGRGDPDVWCAWGELCRRQGAHVLAPFIRANTGISRLVFRYDPQFSADAVTSMIPIIEDGTRGGYWSEWLLWEVHDLHVFVVEQEVMLASLGVSTERIDSVFNEMKRRANQKGRSIHVPI